MNPIPEVSIEAVMILDGSICGKSQSQIARTAIMPNVEYTYECPVTVIAALPLIISVRTE